MSDWRSFAAKFGITSLQLSTYHWRTSSGDGRIVDFWPGTGTWRDLHSGEHGTGVKSLVAHYRRPSQLSRYCPTNPVAF